MKIEQRLWTAAKQWTPKQSSMGDKAQLLLVFGETGLLRAGKLLDELRACYPKAHLFGCSTSGEIQGDHVNDDTVATTAIEFRKTRLAKASVRLKDYPDSFQAGARLAAQLEQKELSHVLVLSVGLGVNGSELVKGIMSVLPAQIGVSGGLAGDKERFQETFAISGTEMGNDMVAAVGLYGRHIRTSSASLGGWDPFGPERVVTRSKANVLYELDGKSALEVYKSYLGEHARELPGSALLFPLSIRIDGSREALVRTILGIDEKEQSMTFAGDIPQGCHVRMMKANFDRLIDGASGAAKNTVVPISESTPDFALLISCVGRKIVLKQRIEEEIEGVRNVLGDSTALTGFYSYGEISPFTPGAKCELHNQTMTITTLSESDEEAA